MQQRGDPLERGFEKLLMVGEGANKKHGQGLQYNTTPPPREHKFRTPVGFFNLVKPFLTI